MAEREPRFQNLLQVSAAELAEFLRGELPLLAAVVLNQMPPAQTAKILANLPADHQQDIVANMSKARQTPPEVLDSLSDGLSKKVNRFLAARNTPQPESASQDDPLAKFAWKPREMKGITPSNAPLPSPEDTEKTAKIIPAFPPATGGAPSRPAPTAKHPGLFSPQPQQPAQPSRANIAHRTPMQPSAPSAASGRPAPAKPAAPVRPEPARPGAPAAAPRPARPVPAGKGPRGRQAMMEEMLAQLKQRTQAGNGKGGAHRVDGLALAAEILRYADPDVRHRVRDAEPRLYDRLHDRMFVFDDLNNAPDATLGVVFSECDADRAALALRFASPRLQERVLKAVSPRRGNMLAGQMQGGSGRVRISDVESAQQELIEFALQLQSSGRILIDASDPDLA